MTTRQRFRRSFTVLLLASAMILMTMTADAAVQYVTPEGKGAKTGSSWDNAYDEAAFPAAILSAVAGDEIWVKAGVYRPVIPADPASVTGAEQQKSFVLSNDVALYGGFAGTETSSADRNRSANVTVLTGDLANDDTHDMNGVTVNAANISGDNSACVVVGSGVTAATVLDGFTITAGNNTTGNGGGMCNHNSSPTVTHCAFSGNRAHYGGGMCNQNSSSPKVTYCIFSGNFAIGDLSYGGGMYNDNSSPTVTDCAFSGNSAKQTGGGMYNVNGSSPAVKDCTFSGNSSEFLRRDVQRRQQSGSDELHVLREQRPFRWRRDVQLYRQRPDRDELHLLERLRRRNFQHHLHSHRHVQRRVGRIRRRRERR